MENLRELKDKLSSPKKIVITTHANPDADALGSSLGLMHYLQKLGHQVDTITPTKYPEFLSWMKGNESVIVYSESTKVEVTNAIEKSEIIFCLDFSALARVGDMEESINKSTADKVLIDHHLEPENFANYKLWDTSAAATAELVYDLIHDFGDEQLIDKDIAECLYSGILTDTGGFKHPNVTKHVFNVSASLIAKGADTAKVSKLIYDNNTESRIRLLGFSLINKLKVLRKYHTAYFALSAKDLKRFNAQSGDTEGLVNYALSIKDIKLAALFKESDGIIKISFRSIGDLSVNELAREYFNGGGHFNAAGGKSQSSLEDTVDHFEKILEKYKTKLNK